MITGFNTDISYGGTTYHVQTEDKGSANPLILSLVYVRGTILAAKRTSYAKELENGLAEQQLQIMLEKQHRTILAVIKAGRIQELVDKLNKSKSPEDIVESPKLAPSFPTSPPIPFPQVPNISPKIPISQPAILNAEPRVESIIGAQNSVLEDTYKDISQPLFAEFDLDKIIFDYLQTDAQEEKLEISIKGNKDFYSGESVLLQIEVSRGGERALPNVPVIVKVLGTAFKPQVYSGRTGPDGVAIMPVALPQFTAGSAAIVIQSSSNLGEAEARHLIRRR